LSSLSDLDVFSIVAVTRRRPSLNGGDVHQHRGHHRQHQQQRQRPAVTFPAAERRRQHSSSGMTSRRDAIVAGDTAAVAAVAR